MAIINRMPMGRQRIDISEVTITPGAALTYNGFAQEKSYTLTYNGETLIENVHYTRSHTKGTDAYRWINSGAYYSKNEYTETFTGIGRFTGTRSEQFTIKRRETTVSTGFTWTGTPVVGGTEFTMRCDYNNAYATRSASMIYNKSTVSPNISDYNVTYASSSGGYKQFYSVRKFTITKKTKTGQGQIRFRADFEGNDDTHHVWSDIDENRNERRHNSSHTKSNHCKQLKQKRGTQPCTTQKNSIS